MYGNGAVHLLEIEIMCKLYFLLCLELMFFADMFSSSKLKHSTSDSADKNGVKNRLKKFIIRRPSMKTLQEKGLIKGFCFFFVFLM